MAKFDAGTAVEALDYDFTKFVPGCEGVIPEPTTDQIEIYFNSVRELAKDVQALKAKAEKMEKSDEDGEELSSEEVDAILAEMDDLSIKTYQTRMVEMTAALCSNTPTAEQIGALPHRVLQAFLQWITGEFRPEARTATTRR